MIHSRANCCYLRSEKRARRQDRGNLGRNSLSSLWSGAKGNTLASRSQKRVKPKESPSLSTTGTRLAPEESLSLLLPASVDQQTHRKLGFPCFWCLAILAYRLHK